MEALGTGRGKGRGGAGRWGAAGKMDEIKWEREFQRRVGGTQKGASLRELVGGSKGGGRRKVSGGARGEGVETSKNRGSQGVARRDLLKKKL